MKTSRPVCILCRHMLANSAARRQSQWQPQAAYSTEASAQADSKEPSSNAKFMNEQEKFAIRRVFGDGPRIKVPLGGPLLSRRDTKVSKVSKPHVDVDALFQQIIGRHNLNEAASPDAVRMGNLELALVHDIGKLQQMLDQDLPVSEAYYFLRTEIYPSIRQEGITVPQIAYTVVNNLMQKIIGVKKHRMSHGDLPPVAEIFRVCADFGDLRVGQWMLLVSQLLTDLCTIDLSPKNYPSVVEFEKQLALHENMLADLIESWKILSLPKHMAVRVSDDENDIIDGFWFPNLDKFKIKRFRESQKFPLAFSGLFPQYPAERKEWKLSILGIATFILLMDSARSNVNARRSASRFMGQVASLINQVPVEDNSLRRSIKELCPSLESYIMDKWPKVRNYVVNKGPAPEESKDSWINNLPRAEDGIDTISLSSQLKHAYKTQNGAQIDRLWQAFISKLKILGQKKNSAAEAQKYIHVFESFINAYMVVNQPDKAIMVWNSLPKFGLKVRIETWNVLLDGCKKARNASALKRVWERLDASGMRLDTGLWTTRVAGLVDSGEVKAGFEALEEMVDRWTKAVNRGATQSAVRPTIEPVNAALAGLIRVNNMKAAEKLISWAISRGIKPDIWTFNMLLKPFVRDDRQEDIASIFKTMENHGIHPDEATFTVMLDATLARLDPTEDGSAQEELVAKIISTMEKAGLKANAHTYGKIMHLLLKQGDRSKEAVKSVMAHMWSRGLELSPHIYTMLVEHFFRINDLAAVSSILERKNLLTRDDMDRMFLGRVIKGFARAGDLDAALAVYRRLMAQTQFLPEIDTQFLLLKGLVRTGRLDEARWLVRIAEAAYRRLQADGYRGYTGSMAEFWRHPFWVFAVRGGVLERLPGV